MGVFWMVNYDRHVQRSNLESAIEKLLCFDQYLN